MPQIQSAKKRVRVAARQAEENRLHRSRSRTAIKAIRTLIDEGKTKEAAAEMARAQSYLDKTAKRNAWHKNAVARYKSRLAAALKAAGYKETIPARTKSAETGKKAAKKPAAKPAAGSKPKKAPSASQKKPAAPAKKK